MTAEQPHELVAAGYDGLAIRWDAWSAEIWPPLRETYVTRFLELLPDQPDVLELGCGTGVPVAAMLADRSSYHGVDVSPQMIALARRQVPAGRFQVADMREFTAPRSSVDGVVALYSIVHVPRRDHAALFRSIHGWLRPGGWFLAALHARDEEGWLEDDWLDAGPMFWSGFNAATNVALVEEAGFDPVRWEVRSQTERGPGGDDEVRFTYLLAQRP